MRHRSLQVGLPAFLALIASVFACHARAPESAQTPLGCYRFDRPVSYSASGERERADSAWYVIELLAEGAVSRPYLDSRRQAMFAARSAWSLSGDTLRLRVFDGLVGWDMALVPDQGSYHGRARYLSDARAVGYEPPTADFTAHRALCGKAL